MSFKRVSWLLMLLIGTEMLSISLAAENSNTKVSSSPTSSVVGADKQVAGSTTKASEKSTKPKSKVTDRTEAEISALTSETSDQIYGRVSVSRMSGKSGWWVRSGYGITKTRTYSNKKVNATEVGTFNLDSQYRSDRDDKYNFISAVATIRNRSPYSAVYGDKTGYYMLSAGMGRNIMPVLEGEIALAKITRYEDEVDHRIAPVYSLRLKTNLTSSATLDGYTHLVQPFTNDMLVDTRVNLTYTLTPSVSVRFTYVTNNMLKPFLDHKGWDKSLRVSLVFSRTKS